MGKESAPSGIKESLKKWAIPAAVIAGLIGIVVALAA